MGDRATSQRNDAQSLFARGEPAHAPVGGEREVWELEDGPGEPGEPAKA